MKPKKLILNKETLRDLTAQNANAIKGGAPLPTVGCSLGTVCPTSYYTCKGKGKTYNKKCW